jgi:hypothetical protein
MCAGVGALQLAVVGSVVDEHVAETSGIGITQGFCGPSLEGKNDVSLGAVRLQGGAASHGEPGRFELAHRGLHPLRAGATKNHE